MSEARRHRDPGTTSFDKWMAHEATRPPSVNITTLPETIGAVALEWPDVLSTTISGLDKPLFDGKPGRQELIANSDRSPQRPDPNMN